MDSNRLVLNTLLAQQAHNEGVTQPKLIENLLGTGIHNIEIRREYGNSTLNEMKELSKLRQQHQLNYFYSVPDNLFVDHQINVKLLQYVAEAQLMGIGHIKMTLGDFDDTIPNVVDDLLTMIPAAIQLNIENDQTMPNSDTQKLTSFFKQFEGHERKVGFVNDLGNWIFTKQDVETATDALLEYTSFVHLKSYVLNADKQPETVPFADGTLDWQALINKFDQHLPVALEYPASPTKIKADIDTIVG